MLKSCKAQTWGIAKGDRVSYVGLEGASIGFCCEGIKARVLLFVEDQA